MVTQVRRGEEEKRRRGDEEIASERSSVSRRVAASPRLHFRFSSFRLFFLSLCLFVSAVIFSSCSSKPVNLQEQAPADALVYIETNDLGKTVEALTTNPTFQKLAAKQPDLSALRGIQLAVAVTGFEISEETLSEDDKGLNFRPRFVAIAETHAWNYQARAFTEHKLGGFINEVYGGEIDLETEERHGGRYFTWTAQDGRHAFALVLGSRIFFGNDESAIEKCLAVMRGETDSFAKTGKVAAAVENTLAAGYISPDGVAQIATLAGTVLGHRSSESEDAQKFISGVLPPILQKTVREVTWMATQTGHGIEDRFTFAAEKEAADVWKQTLVRSGEPVEDLASLLPPVPMSVTRYNLKNPQVAWRSVLLLAAKQAGEVHGPILLAFSGSLFDPYGVADGELFLSAVGPEIYTARFDAEGEKTVVVAIVKDPQTVKKAIGKEIDFTKPGEKQGNADVWKSGDGDIAAAFIENKLILGDAESVRQCLARGNASNFISNEIYPRFSASNAVAVTFGRDAENAGKIVDVFADRKEGENPETSYITETRFNEKGIERTTVSEFGLIGDIVEHLSE
jgi:hypothetical protein